MRVVALLACLLLGVGCGSLRSRKPTASQTPVVLPSHPANDVAFSKGITYQKPVVLPEYAVDDVTFTNGITQTEAELVAASYFRRVVGSCGMPDKPEDQGDFWRVQLWGGIAGSDYGHLLIAKDGRKILLQPPRKGLRSSSRALLDDQGVPYE